MNALSFRLFPWYSSGIFVLTVIILTSIFVVGVKGVSFFIIALFSSVITLSVSYSGGGYNGLSVALDIKPGACGLGGCSSDIYSLSF